MIKKLRESHETIVLVDCGDMFFNTRTIPKIRAKTILEGMEYMNYDAVNLGEGELDMGLTFLIGELEKHPVKIVSSNLQIVNEKNENIVAPYIIKDFSTIKIGITGITPSVMIGARVQQDDNLKISDPLPALKKNLLELKKKTNLIILLSHFRMKGTKNLLTYNDLSDVSVAVAGHGRSLTEEPKKVGDTLIVQNSMGGEYLSVLTLQVNEDGKILEHKLENIALSDEIPSDNYLRAKMDEFKALESKSLATDQERKQIAKTQKERKEILQLSPEAFIKRMKMKNTINRQ